MNGFAIVRGGHTGDAILLPQQSRGLVTHEQFKAGETGGLPRQEIKEIPLRHESDEFAAGRDMAEIGHLERSASNHGAGGSNLLMEKLQEFGEDSQLVEDIEGGGVHRVAAEITEEVLMFFQHGDAHAGAREKVTQHDSRRSPTDHTAGCCAVDRHHWS